MEAFPCSRLVEGDAGGKWSEKVEYARASTATGMFFFLIKLSNIPHQQVISLQRYTTWETRSVFSCKFLSDKTDGEVAAEGKRDIEELWWW
jgi:hypothetical protein